MYTNAIQALLGDFAREKEMHFEEDGKKFTLSYEPIWLSCDRTPEGKDGCHPTDMLFERMVTVYAGPRRPGHDEEMVVEISAMAMLSHQECRERNPLAHCTKTFFHNYFVVSRGKFPQDASRLQGWLEVARALTQAMTKADLVADIDWAYRMDYDKRRSPIFCTIEDPSPLSEANRLPMHWRTGVFPSMGDIWLVRFKNGDVCICRVESSDDLGGNLVELSLQCLRWEDGATFEKSYDFYNAPREHDIESWDKVDAHANSEEWKRLVKYYERSSAPKGLEPAKIKGFVESVVHSELVCQKVVIPAAVYIS